MKYAKCNFDGKPIHPEDQKVIDTFTIWLNMDNEEKRNAVRLDPEWQKFVFGSVGEYLKMKNTI